MKKLFLLMCVFLTACGRIENNYLNPEYATVNYACTEAQWDRSVKETEDLIRITKTNMLASRHFGEAVIRNCKFREIQK